MATDARVRYTKMVISNSFIQLLKDKPIQKITIKEICEMAEINRATFYKHYVDVYDLLEQTENSFLDELKSVLSARESSTVKDIFTIIMVSLKAEEETYQAVCSANGDPAFPAKAFDVCYQISKPRGSSNVGDLSEIQKEWLYQFLAHGCNGVLESWIAKGMQTPISEVVDFVTQLVDSAMSPFSQYAPNEENK